MRDIAIFRQNLFKLSEPFIVAQAGALTRYRPVYMGWLRWGSAPDGAQVLALRDRFGWPTIGWQMVGGAPGPYLRLLGERKPALIHAHFGVEGVAALPLARRLGVPLVTSFHGFDATLSTTGLFVVPNYTRYALLRGRLARQGDLFLCASGFIRDRLLALGFPAARTHVHYIGVDIAAITPRPTEEETATILHVARLVPVKGTETLLRAFALLPPRHRGARLEIIGGGPLRARLEKLAASLGVAGSVFFRGALLHAEVLAAMRRAAMLVLSSVQSDNGREEGLGMVMLEAAATGLPVIGSRSGGIPEGIIEGETGFLVPQRDAGALAAHITALLDDTALRQRMGAAARRMVTAKFDLARQTAALETLYDSLL